MNNDELRAREQIELVVRDTGEGEAASETDPKTADRLDDLTGTVLGGLYKLEEFLGRGGMGDVYKARDIALNRWVAIKLLSSQMTSDSLQRFQQEGRALCYVVHQNIAAVHSIALTDDQRPYIVMEFVDGKPLSKIIREESPLSPFWVLHMISQVCSALAPLHAAGIIHRDLKPDNILIAQNADGKDLVKIVDFGIAKDLTSGQELTQPGFVVGTPLYLSPERYTASETDARSDIYSLGCVLFEMLTGRPPFEGSSKLEIMRKHVDEPPPRLPAQFARMQTVLDAALAKDKEKRYTNVEEFAGRLHHSFYRDWKQMLLVPPLGLLPLMEQRKKPPNLERPMIIFWSSLLTIFVSSIVSIFLPKSLKFVPLIVDGIAAVIWMYSVSVVFRAPKSTAGSKSKPDPPC